ncbi:MAG: hypothetical protein PHD21_01615 [Flavobacteriales bacterium]|nr:hypothetical protein [Flavobacteriales bacterium]
MSDITQDTPKSRLLLFCRSVGLSSNKEIERLFCLANGFFNTVGGGMNTDSLAKIISIYPNINISWLITGKGNMFYSATVMSAVAEKGISYQKEDFMMPIRVFSSYKDVTDKDDVMPPVWRMLPKSAFSQGDFLLKITNDSMSAVYEKGQFFLLGHISSLEKKLLCCSLEGGDFICAVPEILNGGAVVRFSFPNEDKNSYPDIVLPASQIKDIWIVKGVYSF